MSPGAGFRHENIMGELFTRLRSFAKERGLGLVMPSNLLYVLPEREQARSGYQLHRR